ncbi:MAG: SDR family oxidoreductase [bacterium]
MNPRALVTGASGAIGSDITKLLIDNGWDVLGTYHQNPGEVPKEAKSIQCSLDQPDNSIPKLLGKVTSHTDFLNALIHTAGPVRDEIILNMHPTEWDHVRKVHLDSAYYLARNFRSLLLKDSNRDIPSHYVLFSSLVGLEGSAGQSNYAAAKSALIGFTTSLSKEWAPDILVNALRPAFTQSRMTEDMSPSAHEEVKREIITGTIADPRQTSELIGYLLNQHNLTGQILSTDHRSHPAWR